MPLRRQRVQPTEGYRQLADKQDPENVETRTLAKHIETLRKKLGDAGTCIRTVHGVGYRFMSDNASAVR